MKQLLFISVLSFPTLFVSAQTRSSLWLSAEINREVIKDVDLNFNTNIRFQNPGGLNSLYQELGAKYSGFNWVRPSIDYRLITSYDERNNYTISHRLNLNLDFRKKFNDFKVGIRFRYQLYLANWVYTDSDLDPYFRIKPHLTWNIPKKKFTPELTVEFFYNPIYGPYGRSFNRIRYGANVEFDLPHKQTLTVQYYFGHKFYAKNPYTEHILSLTYSYNWKKKKKKDNH